MLIYWFVPPIEMLFIAELRQNRERYRRQATDLGTDMQAHAPPYGDQGSWRQLTHESDNTKHRFNQFGARARSCRDLQSPQRGLSITEQR